MKPALVSSYSEQVTHRVRLQILSGQLAPGQRLREETLARDFGISRGPVRDTFLQLRKEGLLAAQPHVGVQVADAPSPFKRKVLLKLRRSLEVQALQEGMRTNAESLLHSLSTNTRAYHDACQQGDMEPVVALDMQFHEILVTSADGASLLAVWQPVITQMFLRYSRHHTLLDSYEEHAAILAALEQGDVRLAAKRLKAHIV